MRLVGLEVNHESSTYDIVATNTAGSVFNITVAPVELQEPVARVTVNTPCNHQWHRVFESGPRDNGCGYEDICRLCWKKKGPRD